MLPTSPFRLFNDRGQMRLNELDRMRHGVEQAPLIGLDGQYSQSPAGVLFGRPRTAGGSGSATPFAAKVFGPFSNIKQAYNVQLFTLDPTTLQYTGGALALLWNVAPMPLTTNDLYLCFPAGGQFTSPLFAEGGRDVYLTMAGWAIADNAGAVCFGSTIQLSFNTY